MQRHPGVAGVFGQGKVRKKPGLDGEKMSKKSEITLFEASKKGF